MVDITRFNPLEDVFENLFRGIPVRLPSAETRAIAPAKFRVDVTENEKEYQVLAELPGVKKDEISITIDGNEVVISAEVKREREVKDDETVLRTERYFGKVQREFAFSNEIDEAAAKASYNDGVLELTLPKKTVAEAKRVAVH